jgi:hypothetical protein
MKIRALFLILAIAFLIQSAHFAEHIAQIIQIYAQGVRPPDAHGLLGAVFDFEWVHFTYNVGLEIVLIALLIAYRRSSRDQFSPLVVSAVIPLFVGMVLFQGYHSVEHITKMIQYLTNPIYQTGAVPTPGILPTLTGWPIFLVHFFINLGAWVLMALAVWRLRDTYWQPVQTAARV